MAVNMGQHHVSPRSLPLHLTDHIRRASGYGADQSRGRHQGRAVPQCRIDLLDWGCTEKATTQRGVSRVAAIASIVWSAWPYAFRPPGPRPTTPAPCPAQLCQARPPVASGVGALGGRMPPAPAPPCRAAHARRAPRLAATGRERCACGSRSAWPGPATAWRKSRHIMLSPGQRQFPQPTQQRDVPAPAHPDVGLQERVARRKHASARLCSPRRRYARPAFTRAWPRTSDQGEYCCASSSPSRVRWSAVVEIEELEIEAADGIGHAGDPVPVLRLGRIVAELLIPL